MIGRIVTVLLVCCVAACTGPQTQEIRATLTTPEKCSALGKVWKLRVRFGLDGTPVGVEADSGNPGPIADPERLEVGECDNVLFTVRKSSRNRSAMLIFDKDPGFRSPGKQPAYLSRKGAIIIPIDNREGTGKEEFAYSIHVDCPESIGCAPIDPRIVVER